jgi:hypothetical protein
MSVAQQKSGRKRELKVSYAYSHCLGFVSTKSAKLANGAFAFHIVLGRPKRQRSSPQSRYNCPRDGSIVIDY